MVHAELRGRRTERRDVSLRCLVHLARNGNQRAWAQLVSRYSGLVWSITRAHRLSDADAADVSQATWLKLVEHLDRVREPEALAGWLATTARRECVRVLQRAARTVPVEDAADVPSGGRALDERLLRTERDAELWRAFAQLRPADQALLRLLSAAPAIRYAEIAATLQMPIGSIGPTRARALTRLRRELDRLA